MVDFMAPSQTRSKPTSESGSPRARRRITILVPRYRGIVVYWYSGAKMIDFVVPSQRGEKGPVTPEALAREGEY